MKLYSHFIFLITLILFADKSLSLTEYQIKKICEREQKTPICIKNLREKKSNLEKGYLIEIPVMPYRK